MPTSPDRAPTDGAPPRAGRAPTVEGLRLLARAVAGRPLEVRPDERADEPTHLDAGTLVVPAPLTADVRDQVLVQAALLAAGSLEPGVLRSLVGRRQVTARYCALEGVRAVRLLADALPPALVRRVTAVPDVPRSDGPEHSRRLADRPGPAPAPDFFGRIHPLRLLVSGGDLTASAPPARPAEADGPEDDERDEGEQSALLAALSNPMAGDNALSRMMRRMLGGSAGPDSDPDGGGPTSSQPVVSTRPPARRTGMAAVLGSTLAFARGPVDEPGGARYPEWDHHRGDYRPGWVQVHEHDPWNPDGPRDLSGLPLVPAPRLRRALARVVLAEQHRGRAEDGETLHPDGVVDLARWRRAPSGAPPRPFTGSRPTRPDVAVLVLLDASSSTRDDTPDQVPVFDAHLALAQRVTAALDELGVAVGLYGFQAWGRSAVRFLRITSFTERAGAAARHRLAHLEPAGYTRIGGAFRHATALLERAAPGTRRVIVLVSDGFPYDEGYEGEYAAADTRRAMTEARALGIGCVCVGVTAPSEMPAGSGLDALAAASALHVADARDIERHLAGLVRRALHDARRRGDHTVSSASPRRARA